MADEGIKRMAIAFELGIAQENVVTTWVKRWLAMSDRPVAERLQDLPRSGAPDTLGVVFILVTLPHGQPYEVVVG